MKEASKSPASREQGLIVAFNMFQKQSVNSSEARKAPFLNRDGFTGSPVKGASCGASRRSHEAPDICHIHRQVCTKTTWVVLLT